MKATVSIRLPDILTKNLDEIAKETERSRSFHIQKAIEMYIEDFADLRIAIDRLRNPKDEIVSSKDLRKSLGL
jgi:RHH-type rel operon transcriptional repressor/antitoxin RelB